MKLDLVDKVFVISGSSRGIGKSIARILLSEGAIVVLTGREETSLSRTFSEMEKDFPGRSIFCAGDLNIPETLSRLEHQVQATYSRIDGIVANAGSVKPVKDHNIPLSDWEWYFDANFHVAIRFISKLLPLLSDNGGAIVCIGSIAGVEDIGAPGPYSSAKAALAMYAKGLARELSPRGIRVNTIAPGNIFFPGGNWDKKQDADPQGVQRIIKENVPLRMFGRPEDIGYLAAFLLSPRAQFITGGCIVADGGQTRRFL